MILNLFAPFREGMRVVMGDPENSGKQLQNGRKRRHHKDLLAANLQVDYGRCSRMDVELISALANEHRRKAPTWGSPRIPECMYSPDPFPSACITKVQT